MSSLDIGSGPGAVMRLDSRSRGTCRQRHRRRDRCQARCARRSPTSWPRAVRQVRADRGRPATARRVTGRAVRLSAYCRLLLMHMRTRWRARKDGVVGPSRVACRGAGIRFRRDRDRAAMPGHERVQSPVRGRVRGAWVGTCEPGANFRCNSRRPGLGVRTARLPRRNSCPLKDMAAMLVGVYQSLFASATELGMADPGRAERLQGRHRGGRRGRALLLSDPHSDWRLEAACITRTRACRSNLPASPCGP